MASATGPLPQILDGFSYNDQLIYQPNRYWPLALAELDTLRRAANLRPREWCVPDNFNQPIAGFDTFYYQISINGGSYLWGYNFVTLSAIAPGGAPAVTTATDMLIQLTDSCTEVPIFQDFASGGGCSTSGNARCFPILLTKPRLILDPGLINVEIANRTPNAIVCQLRLRFAENCKIADECSRERVWKFMGQ